MRKGELGKELPAHGTLKRYRHRSQPCRDGCCREIYNEYMRVYKQRPEQRRKRKEYDAAYYSRKREISKTA